MTGCATAPGTRPPPPPSSAADLYAAGRAAADGGDYDKALDLFRKLEVYYPGDQRAVQAEIETVYVYYQARDYASVAAAAGRFIRRHPDYSNLDYLYYLRGLARFDEALEALANLPADTPSDKPPALDMALQNFAELIARYPQSRYSDDARNRMALLRQKLGEFELATAKLYLARGDYIAAELHARNAIDRYPDSGVANEATTVMNMARHLRETGSAPDQTKNPPQAQAAAPKAAASTSEGDGAADALQREDWILNQNPNAYTIQLFITSREEVLLGFVRRHRLCGAAYYQVKTSDRPGFSLLYGLFDTPDDARAAAEKLPAELRGERPWIRRMAEVQAAIRQTAETPP